MSDLDRSSDYYEKLERLKENILPAQSNIRAKLGDPLTDVLFETCTPAMGELLGLMPPLLGPGDDLWISPSDLLIGKVRLKPPLTSKHVQALTHEGILAIGKITEIKVRKEFEAEMESAIAEQQEIWNYIYEKEKLAAIAKQKLEDEHRFALEVETLKEEFLKQLEMELTALEMRLEEEKGIAVEEGKKETQRTMQQKLEYTVSATVYKLTDIFAMELLKQSHKMHEHFWFHLKEEKKKRRCVIEQEKLLCQENLRKLRHELECENVANTMYILANERMKCNCEKAQMKQMYLGEINALQRDLDERNQLLEDYISENRTKTSEIAAREAYLFEIIKQFQKFIYFSLRAVPTQAEFLLNVEKLMIFELTKTIIDNKPDLIDDILFFSEEPSTADTSTYGSASMANLVAPDCHKCDSFAEIISLPHSLEPEDDLPAFIFNENVYLREDFRNMISQGLEISKNNELWSHAIDRLTKTYECDVNVSSEKSKESSTTESDSIPSNLLHRSPLQLSFRQKTSPTSVKFTGQRHRRTSDAESDPILTKLSEKLLKSHKYDVSPAISYVMDLPRNDVVLVASKIALARNSLTLVPTHLRVDSQSFTDDSEPKIIDIDIAEALIAKATPTAKVSLTPVQPLKRFSSSLRSQTTVRSEKSVDIIDCRVQKFERAIDSVLLVSRRSADTRADAKQLLYSSHKDSRIEGAKDSLPLIQMKLKKKGKGRMSSFERLPDNLRWGPQKQRNVNVQCGGEKKVSISHFEVIPDDDVIFDQRQSHVMFNPTPKIIPDQKPVRGVCPICAESELDVDDFFTKPNEGKIVGDRSMNVHLQKQSDFTLKRIDSFLSIFRKRPSLRMLFTETLKN